MSVFRSGNVIDHARLIQDLLLDSQWEQLELGNFQTAGSFGSGFTATGAARSQFMSSGNTAGSGIRRRPAAAAWSRGHESTIIDWSKAVLLKVVFTPQAISANGIYRIGWGDVSSSSAPVVLPGLVGKGIALRFTAVDIGGTLFAALHGEAHNGVGSQDVVDLGSPIDPNEFEAHEVVVRSDGRGNVQWFVNGELKGTSVSGPTELSDPGRGHIELQIHNGGDAAHNEIEYHQIAVRVGQ